MRTRSPFFVACSFLLACGDDAVGDPTGAGGSSTTGAGGATTTGTGGQGQGGSGVYDPPPVPVACTAPTVTPAATWTAASGQRFFPVKLAWTGSEAALAYAESTAADAWSVKLQRLSGQGAALGAPIVLGTSTGTFGPTVSIAASGSGYVVCWDRAVTAGDMQCAAIAAGASVSTPGLTRAGQSPSVAFGPAGFGLVLGAGNEFLSQHLDANGAALGSVHVVATNSGAELAGPVLTATDDGYASLEVYWVGGLWRFDVAFEEEEGDTFLGWVERPTSIVGSGTHVGAVWGGSQAVTFRVVDAANVATDPIKIDATGASSIYQHVDVARGDASFAAVWSAFEGTVGYRAVGLDGVPLGTPLDLITTNWDDNPVAIAGVSDGFLVASAVNIGLDVIEIVHLGCP